MPKCKTNTEEIGIILNEQIMIKVGDEEKLLEYGSLYYAPAGVSQSGYNTSDKAIYLIKLSRPYDAHLVA